MSKEKVKVGWRVFGPGNRNTGSVSGMAAYNAAKVVVGNETTFDMTLAGTTFFTVASTASYGYNRAFPSGSYTALILAECIAK